MALEVKKKYPVPHKTKPHYNLPQRTFKAEQRKASIKRASNITLVLGTLLVIAGVGYTWYAGKHYSVAANTPEPVASRRVTIKPSKVASDAPIGSAIQAFTQEVRPGENASVSIRTNAEAECSIAVRYGEVAAVDSGLVPKVADEFGVASWAWTVPATAPLGKSPADITCKNKKNFTMVRAEIVLKK